MASYTFTDPEGLFVGTVEAYAAVNWAAVGLPPRGTPVGSPAASEVGANGQVTFAGLDYDTQYYAAALVGGVWRYVGFSTPSDTSPAVLDARLDVLEGESGGGSGGGSLLFGQAAASLSSSMPWRATGSVHLVLATLTVAEAVVGAVDVCDVAVNGDAVETLSLEDDETTSTTAIDISLVEGDLLTVVRLATDGGACQVQLDRGA